MGLGSIAAISLAGLLFLRLFPGIEGDPLAADLRNLNGSPENIRALAADAGIPQDWADFLVAKAWVESRWSPTATRGVPPGPPAIVPEDKIRIAPTDAAAAAQAFNRQREAGHLADTPWPVERYTFGTGGLWQLMPANAIVLAFKGTEYENLDPWSHYMTERAIAMAVEYNRALMRRQSYKDRPTWATLYAGWSRPDNMGKPGSPDVTAALERFAKGLQASGLPASFMDKKPTPRDQVPSGIEILEAIGRVRR